MKKNEPEFLARLRKSKLPHDRLRQIAAGMILRASSLTRYLHLEYLDMLRDVEQFGTAPEPYPVKLGAYQSGEPWQAYEAYQAVAGPLWRSKRNDILGYPAVRCVKVDKDPGRILEYLKRFPDLMGELAGMALEAAFQEVKV